MAIRIISADERLEQLRNKNTFLITGPSKIGKTSLLRTLPPEDTLAVDIEAGMSSVKDWKGESVSVRTYREAAAIACLCGGPNPALRDKDMFSLAHYNAVVNENPDLAVRIRDKKNLFWDSITDLTRLGFQYAAEITPPSDKTGKEDVRGQYGNLGREVVSLLKHVQFGSAANVIFVSILDKATDEFNRDIYTPQMMGGMISRELPGIVDNIFSLVLFDFVDGQQPVFNFEKGQHRAFVCHRLNPWGLPAGTRSDALELLERPDLGYVIDKINAGGVLKEAAQ